jgi:predicted phosphodiesterase
MFAKRPADRYVIVITGDVIDSAKTGFFSAAGQAVAVLRQAGYTVLAVPGNHDYANLLYGQKKNVELFKAHFFLDPGRSYPKLDIIENTAFVGLDSMAEELHWHDSMWANGELGAKKGQQIERLDKLLKSPAVKACEYKVIYLHHHPFEPVSALHKLKDAEEFCRVLKTHPIDALLFGHNHHGKKWNGFLNIPRCYDGSSSTFKNGGRCEHRVIDLSRDATFDYNGDFFGNYEI